MDYVKKLLFILNLHQTQSHTLLVIMAE